jgi:site-specific DNA recombinase
MTIEAGTRRVATYERVSSEDQRDRETIRTQTEEIARQLDREPGVMLVERYVDDGVSGMIPMAERPAGGKLLRDAIDGQFEELWIYKVDRLGRGAVDLLLVRRKLDDLGIKLVSIVEGAPDLLGYDVQAVVSDHYRREFLRRSADGMNRAAQEGRYTGGIVAYGYRVEGSRETAHLVPDEVPQPVGLCPADVVRRIYDRLARDHWSCRRIAAELNSLGIPPHYARDGREVRRGKRRERTRGVWRTGRVRNLVANPLYRGESFYGRRTKKRDRELISARVEGLVSEEVWAAAQATLATNRLIPKNTRRIYLLRGVLTCGLCGMRYGGTQGGEGAWWYRCGGRRVERGHFDGRCPNRLVRGPELERRIWTDVECFLRNPGDIVGELDGGPERDEAAAISAAQMITLSHRLDALATERSGFLRLAARGSLTDASLDAELSRIDNDRAEVERLLGEAAPKPAAEPIPTATVDLLGQLRTRLEAGLSDVERHEIVGLLVRATVYGNVSETGATGSRVVVEYRFPCGLSTRTGMGSSQRSAGSGPGSASLGRPGRSRHARLPGVGGAPRGRRARTRPARRGTGHHGPRASLRPATSAARHRPSPRRTGCDGASGPAPAGEGRGSARRPRPTRRWWRPGPDDRQAGQETWDRPSEEGLARAGRPLEQQPVAPGEGDLEGPAGFQLPADLGKVRHIGKIAFLGLARRLALAVSGCGRELDPGRRRQRPTARPGTDRIGGLAKARDTDDIDVAGQACLLDGIGGDDDPTDAAAGKGRREGQDPGNGPDLAAERQLPDHREPAARAADLLGSEEDPDGDREVERRAGLAEVGRGQVDGDPSRRVDEARVADRTPDALARLLESRVGQADDREAGQAWRDVDLDPDDPAVEADERGREQGREHRPTLSADAHPAIIGDFSGPSSTFLGRGFPPRGRVGQAGLQSACNCTLLSPHGQRSTESRLDGHVYTSRGPNRVASARPVGTLLESRRTSTCDELCG